jgi:hypothetical protein
MDLLRDRERGKEYPRVLFFYFEKYMCVTIAVSASLKKHINTMLWVNAEFL